MTNSVPLFIFLSLLTEFEMFVIIFMLKNETVANHIPSSTSTKCTKYQKSRVAVKKSGFPIFAADNTLLKCGSSTLRNKY